MARPQAPAQPPALHRALALTLAIAAWASGHGDAWADPVEQVMFTAGRLQIVAQEADTEVTLRDVIGDRQVARQVLASPGARWNPGGLPPVVSLSASAPVIAFAGDDDDLLDTGGWSSFVPTAEGAWVGERFITWADGDLIVTIPHPTPPTDPVRVELLDFEGQEPPVVLEAAEAVASNRRHTVFRLPAMANAVVGLTLSHPGTVQLISDLDGRAGWITTPPSTHRGEQGLGVLSGTVIAAQSALTIIPIHPDTAVELIDLSDGDDSGSWTLGPGQLLSTVPPPGALAEGWQAVVASPLDRDLIEVRASRPVGVVSGAFELLPRRGGATASTPVGVGRHVAFLVAGPGRMHLLSHSRPDLTVTPVAARAALDRVTALTTAQWRGDGPHRAAVDLLDEQLVRVEAAAPFIAMAEPTLPGQCCGPMIAPPPTPTPLAPVAEAGPRVRACPRAPFTLDGNDSFHPEGVAIAAWRWDLDLSRDSDGRGGPDDDLDASGILVTHRVATSGHYRAALTVEDARGGTDRDEVEIQILVPADPSCGGDPDTDGLGSLLDNCPSTPNPDQVDLDGDGLGDACDEDLDGDGVENVRDRCPRIPDPDQGDNDGDGIGDACDPDQDNDGVLNAIDNCPWAFNRDQRDNDGDGLGDTCDRDRDGDGHPNNRDNCPDIPNLLQIDTDMDSRGDLCDSDDDGDGITDPRDNCVLTPNADQADRDNNGIGDACELDGDGDGLPDRGDNCPDLPNPDQLDTDSDGLGDACDRDLDGDFVLNDADNCPGVFNPRQEDRDLNGLGDVCEPDADSDGVSDLLDNCPSTPNPIQQDLDGDGLGDACDEDLDGDGLSQPDERALGTRINHPDTDGDGVSDGVEVMELGSSPILWDTDGDHLSDGQELRWGTDPTHIDTDGDGVADGAEPGWNEDSDLDGLINANDPDSDNGSLRDGEEITLGRNMLDPTDDILPAAIPRGSTACQAAPGAPSGAPWPWLLASLGAALRLKRPRRRRHLDLEP